MAPGKKSHNVLSDEAKSRQAKMVKEMRKNPPGKKLGEFAAENLQRMMRRKVSAQLMVVCKEIRKLPEGDGPYEKEIAKLGKIGAALRELCAED